MTETPEQENERLLAPYIAARNAAAQDCLSALLEGRHARSIELLSEYQLTVVALEAARQVCSWFDDATVADHMERDNSE
jgi:hypothetical protein